MNKSLKVIIWIVVIILVVWGIYALSANNQVPTTNKPIEIGVVIPLTGGVSVYGDQLENGIQLALDEIDKSKVILKFEDSKCDAKEGVSAFNKLAGIENTKIIIGGFCSNVTLAIAPLAEENKVLMITPGSAAKEISEAGDYIFRNHVTMEQKTGALAEFASQNFKKVAVIYNNTNDAFVNGMNVFKETYAALEGYELVGVEGFSSGDADFRSQLSKIKTESPDAMYIGALMPELSLIIKQIGELDIDTQILTDDGVLDPTFLESTGNLSEGIIFGTTRFDETNAPDFWKEYNDSFGSDPTIFSAQAYDTLKIIYSVIQKDCPDGNPTCIKSQLYKLKKYPGASGNTSFDKNGDVEKEVVLKTIENGEFMPYNE